MCGDVLSLRTYQRVTTPALCSLWFFLLFTMNHSPDQVQDPYSGGVVTLGGRISVLFRFPLWCSCIPHKMTTSPQAPGWSFGGGCHLRGGLPHSLPPEFFLSDLVNMFSIHKICPRLYDQWSGKRHHSTDSPSTAKARLGAGRAGDLAAVAAPRHVRDTAHPRHSRYWALGWRWSCQSWSWLNWIFVRHNSSFWRFPSAFRIFHNPILQLTYIYMAHFDDGDGRVWLKCFGSDVCFPQHSILNVSLWIWNIRFFFFCHHPWRFPIIRNSDTQVVGYWPDLKKERKFVGFLKNECSVIEWESWKIGKPKNRETRFDINGNPISCQDQDFWKESVGCDNDSLTNFIKSTPIGRRIPSPVGGGSVWLQAGSPQPLSAPIKGPSPKAPGLSSAKRRM